MSKKMTKYTLEKKVCNELLFSIPGKPVEKPCGVILISSIICALADSVVHIRV